uniref:M14 family zinc carboxypeptidase n=1 Tax=Fulvivirga sp. TaxID=1931237 RepID=UPI00404A1AF6
MKSFLLIQLIFAIILSGCTTDMPDSKAIDKTFSQDLWLKYDGYKEATIKNRRFKHEDVTNYLSTLNAPFTVTKVGESIQGRSISLVSIGSGPIQVLLWSQMHGDESTATMSLLDIFNFIQDAENFEEEKAELLSKLTIHFIPMLNPDGAEVFDRRNTLGIDINRDAVRQQTPEGRLLKQVRDSLKADWGFNLHDQGRDINIGDKPASISFLAPAYNFERTVNDKRADAMRLIVLMNETIQDYIPNSVGRYWDDFEPRAFGDNIQLWGTRTILIESGGHLDDREKQILRKVNFVAILRSLVGIAQGDYNAMDVADYEKIPANDRKYHDNIVTNLDLPLDEGTYKVDLAYRFNERENADFTNLYLEGRISDLGDLQTMGSYKSFDATGYKVVVGKKYDAKSDSIKTLMELPLMELLREGFTDFVVSNTNDRFDYYSVPVKVVGENASNTYMLPEPGDNPSYVLYRDDEAKYALVNGMIIDLSKEIEQVLRDLDKY